MTNFLSLKLFYFFPPLQGFPPKQTILAVIGYLVWELLIIFEDRFRIKTKLI